MATFFIIVFLLSFWHFLWDGVISPSLRHGLRYDFFELRDELRMLKIKGLETKEDNLLYKILDDSMCHVINHMGYIGFANYFFKKREVRENSKFPTTAELVKALLKESKNQELKQIEMRTAKLATSALLINNGSWIPYLILPLIVFVITSYFLKKLDSIYRWLKSISTTLFYSPEELKYVPELIRA